jgi:hypothetical protein
VPNQMFGPALRYRRKGSEEASDALEAAVGCQTHEVPVLQHRPPLGTYIRPGEAKYTVVLVHPAADQYPDSGSSPIVGLPLKKRPIWLAISSLPRISTPDQYTRHRPPSSCLTTRTSHRFVRRAAGLDVGKHHLVQALLIDAHLLTLIPLITFS